MQVINFKQPYTGDSALHCAVTSPFPKRKSVAETLCRYFVIDVKIELVKFALEKHY